eukprot:GHVT01098031.1.p1 GENE.GHVT01098031.1~~GHVT01098031.1.p1  ORF type:complete len:140 (+),score=26.15 GHVT01098031.1:536-955(+)
MKTCKQPKVDQAQANPGGRRVVASGPENNANTIQFVTTTPHAVSSFSSSCASSFSPKETARNSCCLESASRGSSCLSESPSYPRCFCSCSSAFRRLFTPRAWRALRQWEAGQSARGLLGKQQLDGAATVETKVPGRPRQ